MQTSHWDGAWLGISVGGETGARVGTAVAGLKDGGAAAKAGAARVDAGAAVDVKPAKGPGAGEGFFA